MLSARLAEDLWFIGVCVADLQLPSDYFDVVLNDRCSYTYKQRWGTLHLCLPGFRCYMVVVSLLTFCIVLVYGNLLNVLSGRIEQLKAG